MTWWAWERALGGTGTGIVCMAATGVSKTGHKQWRTYEKKVVVPLKKKR
jgi:hypothetical protein